MKRLSVGTISALFLAGVAAPAAFADSHGTLQSQTPSQPQTPGQMQTPGINQTPGQAPNQAPQRVPGQNPGAYPNETPRNQAPRQSPDAGPMQTPGQTSIPSADLNSMGTGKTLATDLVSPFQLAYMAVSGELDQGGSEGYSLYQARHGNAQGQNIVEAAIGQGYISSALMEDQGYINSVNQVLRMQASDWRD